MSVPYVELQVAIIAWLKFRASYDGLFERELRVLLAECRTPDFRLTTEWRKWFAVNNLNLPESITCWNVESEVPNILLEQVDDSGDKLVVRDILGWPLRKSSLPCYDLVGWVEDRGNGDNRLRTERFCQPRMLRVGDVLVTGESVCFEPRDGGNGAVLVKLQEEPSGTFWMEYPARCALALLTPEDNAPEDLVYS